jgi:hypothetical protein
MTNVDLPNALPLATDLATAALSTNIVMNQNPNLSLLSQISTGAVSLNQPGTGAAVGAPLNYAGA